MSLSDDESPQSYPHPNHPHPQPHLSNSFKTEPLLDTDHIDNTYA
jgi:hypothetical protein